jgi:oligoendopeptidase F
MLFLETPMIPGGLVVSIMLSGAALGAIVAAQDRTRAEIEEQYRWNLADLYASDEAWRTAKEEVAGGLKGAAPYRGTLDDSPQQLLEALDLQASQDRTLNRLAVYAALKADEDMRESGPQAMRQEIMQLAAAFGAAWAFVEPELLAMDPQALEGALEAEPRLRPYAFYLRDVLRRKAHTLSAREEELLAQAGPVVAGPGSAASMLLNADLPWPVIKTSDGRDVRLDVAGFSVARASADRAVRQKAMEAFFGALGSFRRTLGTTMNTGVQAALFEARARQYDSSLARALDGPNIPIAVYRELVDGVNRHLPVFHRYLRLRARMLGLADLRYYDLYAPLVADVPLEYTVDEAQRQVRAAVAPLGRDYQDAVAQAFRDRWIDYYPSPGKRSGAYMAGSAYDVHPYLLLNYNGRYDDMSTLAHELGHAMHSWFSNRTQPYPTAGYPIFVAEVASTFNEALLITRTLEQVQDPRTRLAVLGNYLEGVKGTVFRQTQFAEFELRMHEMAQKGEALTGDALSALYLDITRKYYGHEGKVTIVDDYVAHEWAYVSHFYRPFYVFQYATSFAASTALAEKVLEREPGAVERYRTFLASGGSAYPIELLKTAGVDMTTAEPLDLTMRKMGEVLDEMERLLERVPLEKTPQ